MPRELRAISAEEMQKGRDEGSKRRLEVLQKTAREKPELLLSYLNERYPGLSEITPITKRFDSNTGKFDLVKTVDAWQAELLRKEKPDTVDASAIPRLIMDIKKDLGI